MKFRLLITILVVAATQADFDGFGLYGLAELGEYPFNDLIQSWNENGEVMKCEGAIIHKFWVLTDAECLDE